MLPGFSRYPLRMLMSVTTTTPAGSAHSGALTSPTFLVASAASWNISAALARGMAVGARAGLAAAGRGRRGPIALLRPASGRHAVALMLRAMIEIVLKRPSQENIADKDR